MKLLGTFRTLSDVVKAGRRRERVAEEESVHTIITSTPGEDVDATKCEPNIVANTSLRMGRNTKGSIS